MPGGVQFSSTYQPATRGRTQSKWLRDRLSQAARSGSKSAREEIAEHLIEVATSWEVRVVGKDGDGELLKVASARDAVEAAKILFAYDMGAPAKNPNALELSEHLRSVEGDRIRAVIACLGSRLKALSPVEMRNFFDTCSNDPKKFIAMAEEILEVDQVAEGRSQQAQLPEQGEAKP